MLARYVDAIKQTMFPLTQRLSAKITSFIFDIYNVLNLFRTIDLQMSRVGGD